MDGTLVDTEPYWMESEHELVEAYGGTWTDDDARSIVGFDLLDAAAYCASAAASTSSRTRSSTGCSTASSPRSASACRGGPAPAGCWPS